VAVNRISDPSGERGLFANVDGLDTRIHTARGSASARDARTQNLAGDQWFNTETQILQVFDGVAWKNVFTPAPAVTGVSPTTFTGAAGVVLTATGTNFSFGLNCQFISSVTGNVYNGTGVQFTNSTTFTVRTPALAKAGAPYALKVTNLDNGTGTSVPLLNVDAGTAWTTAAGALPGGIGTLAYSRQLQGTSAIAISYSLASGALPSGVTLSSTGLLSGTLPAVSVNTTYSFTVRITDEATTTVDREFTLASTPLPTATSSTPTTPQATPFTVTINGTNIPSGTTVKFVNGATVYNGVNTTWVSATQITSQVPSGAAVTPLTVTLTTPDGAYSWNSPNTAQISPSLSGGSLSSDATYYYRTFTGTNNLIVAGGAVTADILALAGGGAGGGTPSGYWEVGGGGGAGGLLLSSNISIPAGTYSVTVGLGGPSGGQNVGSNGGDSVFSGTGVTTITAVGGGRGGGFYVAGASGGSGGGGGGNAGTTAGNGTSGQGNRGGDGTASGPSSYGGGGGGAGGAGGTPGGGGSTSTYSSWVSNSYGGALAGGGGGSRPSSGGGGGSGGGAGAGGETGAGAQNTGSGGGAGAGMASSGGSGGSGLVVIRYTRAQVGG
jgi:hypothetical protein